ncbi:MAG: 3-hydroxyacyl-[acyl-carrier-protein] dehydratase FabZ [Zetaproteobacteria bacterium]|nr:3-hydroxyacyl-[acyl-carrier-protein] dehydratase FabZ [Pseudobdellovibrionaceae bacterium]|tara:strand:+ start:304 stop:744 length:441 start_codon:yes stop_codon:yes gene_type:complete
MIECHPPFDIDVIQKVLPHRYPFLLVDKVLEMDLHSHIHAVKNVTISDPVFQGHFPGNPVLPGVIIIEGLAQASAILGRLSFGGDGSSILLTEISQARFRRKVIPGDTLNYQVKIIKQRKEFFWFEGSAKVSGEVAAFVKFSAYMN